MKHRILLVEDDAASRELMFDWLAREGYEAQAACDLTSARAALAQERPDAVLLDVGLGDEDGLSLAAWMRQRVELARIPVIAVTAHAMITDREGILDAGCDDYVPKPVDFEMLRLCLRRWTGRAVQAAP